MHLIDGDRLDYALDTTHLGYSRPIDHVWRYPVLRRMQRIVVQRRAVRFEVGILELLVVLQTINELPFSYASLIIGLIAAVVLGEGAGVEGAGHAWRGLPYA